MNMSKATDQRLVHLSRVLIGLPVLSLVLAGLAWLRFGIDMPWFDDWRGYAAGTIDSLEPSYLFQAINDTMSPVGLALDALAQRFLDGNAVAYQFLSMVAVLGLLLVLQWKLLNRALDSRFHVAICFLFTLLMLQPGSYWGLENLAYYQGLPLVFLLSALLLLSHPGSGSAWRGPALGLLGLLAGFTYISGAFAAFAAAIASLAMIGLCHSGPARRQLLRDGAWFAVASAVAVAAQFYFAVIELRETHPRLPLAFPHEAQFWAFYLGKLARSLLLTPKLPLASLVITAMACLTALVAAALLLRRVLASDATVQEKRVVSTYVPMGAMIAVYLVLVAAGRTNFRPPEVQGLLQIFGHGFTRFHFFWAALIWPWVVAALFALGSRLHWYGRSGRQLAATIGVLFALFVLLRGGFNHMKQQQLTAEGRAIVARCLLQELQKGGEVRCEGLLPPRGKEATPDSYPAYAYARKIGASFVRKFPILAHSSLRLETIVPFYRMDGNTATPRMHEIEALGQGRFRAIGNDPQIYIQTNQPQITRHCLVLDVEIEMRVASSDKAQIFFAPAGDSVEYGEANSMAAILNGDGGGFQTLSFRLVSDNGFFESMRLDPVTKPQVFELREIRAYCVRELL